MAPSRSELLQTARAFIESYNTLTISALMAIRSPDCIHIVAPASYGFPPSNNEQYAATFSQILPHLPRAHMELAEGSEPVVDVETRIVSMHVKSHAMTKIGSYDNEYIWTLTITEKGDKVERILEFLDSGYTLDYFKRLGLTDLVS